MKVRNGFVSNSSSSSFLIFIRESIKNLEDFMKMCELHSSHMDDGWMDKSTYDYENSEETPMTNREALVMLWNDIHHSNRIVNKKEWLKNNYSMPENTGYSFEKYCDEYNTAREIARWMTSNDEARDKMEIKLDKMARYWNKLLAKSKFKSFFAREEEGGKIYQISYSDNDGSISCQMEHGMFWEILDALMINEH